MNKVNQFSENKINALISLATNGKYKTFEEAQPELLLATPGGNNEILQNINNKLVYMEIMNLFETDSFFSKFIMIVKETRFNIGAYAQVVSVGLGKGERDDIGYRSNGVTDATKLLPDLTATNYNNYIKTFIINFQRQYETLVFDEIYKRAFTSLQGFGEYLTLYKTRAIETYKKELFEYCMFLFSVSIRRKYELAEITETDDAAISEALRDRITQLRKLLSQTVPYSSGFNLGVATNESVLPVSSATDNYATGMDLPNLPPFLNSSKVEKGKDGMISKFDDFVIIGHQEFFTEYSSRVLGDIYHSGFNSFESLFAGVVEVPDEITEDPTLDIPATFKFRELNGDSTKLTYRFFVVAKDSMILGTNIDAVATQNWSKAAGGYMLQINNHHHHQIVVIPFKNGFQFELTLPYVNNATTLKKGVRSVPNNELPNYGKKRYEMKEILEKSAKINEQLEAKIKKQQAELDKLKKGVKNEF